MRHSILKTVLRWLSVVLILRVLVSIVANYPDYFPPQFDSVFLEGREKTFAGLYPVAFYVHIFTGPVVLLLGLVLLNDAFRLYYPNWHRRLGRVQVVMLLVLVLPSSLVMSRHAYGGWWAGLSFALLSLATAGCAIAGVLYARQRQFQLHRRWMMRCYVLICSAVVLRLVSGAAGLLGVSHPEAAYVLAAWCSWLIPLAGYEMVRYYRAR